jgi:ribonuclease P protein component
VKRYLREVYRTHRAQLPEDLHVVIVARPEAATLSYQECRDAIRRLLNTGDPPGDA